MHLTTLDTMARAKSQAKSAKQTPKAGLAIALRVSEELAEAIEAHRVRLERERPGTTVHTSDVVREILHRALLARQ